MIKKLRNRFLLITMSLITIVLFVTFSVLIISSANRMKSDSIRSLEEGYMRIASKDDRPQPPEADEPMFPIVKNAKPFDGYSPFSTFFVTLDSKGVIRSIDDFSRDLSEDTFSSAAQSALEQGDAEGVLTDLNLRYEVFSKTEDYTVIGFIDISYERSFIKQQAVIYSFIGLGSLVAFLAISFVLSKVAIRPVEKAWNRQRQFVADASHELKTPITVMLANTSILLSGSVKEAAEQMKWISYIDLEAKRMKKLVEDMLFLARVDSKEKEAAHIPMSLSDAVSQSSLPFEAVMYETGKELKCDIQEDIVIKGDEGQMKQLACILLDNANKYAEDNTEVTVILKKDSTKAYLSVKNYGEPIEAEDISHIFDRFIRIDKARGRHKNSCGLGLAIAKEIVKSHSGKITVSSGREKGTVFTVSLPLK